MSAAERGATAEWRKCPNCGAYVYHKRLKRQLGVCPECNHHFRIALRERLGQLLDPGSFEELGQDLEPLDSLGFVDSKPYPERIAKAQRAGGKSGAVWGRATIDGSPLVLAGIDFSFIGGSLGSAVGEAITLAAELALEERTPLLVITASGGARMQEGAVSLMQMAKTSQALARLREEGILYISLLTDPTYGGVTASFATLGDVLIAEPGAHIGFAGPSVIEQTIGQKLPDGFQTAEFLLEHGMVDLVEPRENMRGVLRRLLALHAGPKRRASGGAPASAARDRGSRSGDRRRHAAGARSLGRRPARPQHRPPAHARLRRARLRRLRRAARRPPVRRGRRDRRRPGQARRPHGHGHRPSEGPHDGRDDGAQLRHAQPGGLPQGAAADGLRGALRPADHHLRRHPGRLPGLEAEERGQSVAIAESILRMSRLPVPIVTMVTGEGGSGGALALAASDRVMILEDSYYSVISPEGCATILFKDSPPRRGRPRRCA